MANPTSVNELSLVHKTMMEKWRLPLTLMDGVLAMRKAATRYLPMEPLETESDYRNRLERTPLFNAYRRTVKSMVGKVFAKPVVLKEDMPKELVNISEDIDLTGRHVHLFAQDVAEDGLVCGLSHIFVDMPRSEPGATLADERLNNVRPYFIHVRAQDILGYRSEFSHGMERLTQLRMREWVQKESGEFGEDWVERIRVVYPDYYEIYEQSARGKKAWIIVDSGEMTIGEIPLATFYANRTSFMEAEPPLEDLAWLNVAHWQSGSDQRHILHVTRVPILFGTGLGDDKGPVGVGPNRLMRGPINSDLKYVEHQGNAIRAGRDDLNDLEEQMRIMGLELVQPKPGNPTATGKIIDHGELMSPLQVMSFNLGDCLEIAYGYAAMWMGHPFDWAGSVHVNTDFGIGSHAKEDLDALAKARDRKDISRPTFWLELKRRRTLSEDFDPTKEAALLEQEEEEVLRFKEEEAEIEKSLEPPPPQPQLPAPRDE